VNGELKKNEQVSITKKGRVVIKTILIKSKVD